MSVTHNKHVIRDIFREFLGLSVRILQLFQEQISGTIVIKATVTSMAGGPLFRVEVFSPRSFSSIRTQPHVGLFILKTFCKPNAISIVIYTIENKFINGFPENKKK
ncbi:hypothetical protein [Methanoregula sp.]|uniref:hypothetical protein n=1 Tax=Methanoregula sp. TaxID=2052170 RepID=UPI003C757CC4